MDTLTILFAGLIAHVLTDGGAQRAVLVNAPEHEARLVVAEADILENSGFARDASGAFRLDGERITIDGIPAGDAIFDASYLRHVPSLMRVTDGTRVIDAVQTASPHEAVAAYVDLGRGTFSVDDLYPRQATFGGGRNECIARTVAFRAPAQAEVAFRSASGNVLRVRGGATVRITNNPPPGTRGSHYHMYARILADATHVAEPAATAASCGGTRRRVTTHRIATDDLDTFCSNTGCCP